MYLNPSFLSVSSSCFLCNTIVASSLASSWLIFSPHSLPPQEIILSTSLSISVFLSLSFFLCLCLDVQISWFFSRSISISLCRHAAQEYIRRQLEEEQRQLEILQQQLLQEQALLMVTIALPRATAAPHLCCVAPYPHCMHPSDSFTEELTQGIHSLETPNMSATYLKNMEHKQWISYLQCLLFRSLIAWSTPLSWLDLKGFPKGCRETVLSASIGWAHAKWEHPKGDRYIPHRGASLICVCVLLVRGIHSRYCMMCPLAPCILFEEKYSKGWNLLRSNPCQPQRPQSSRTRTQRCVAAQK